jgi:hypothetical protein
MVPARGKLRDGLIELKACQVEDASTVRRVDLSGVVPLGKAGHVLSPLVEGEETLESSSSLELSGEN